MNLHSCGVLIPPSPLHLGRCWETTQTQTTHLPVILTVHLELPTPSQTLSASSSDPIQHSSTAQQTSPLATSLETYINPTCGISYFGIPKIQKNSPRCRGWLWGRPQKDKAKIEQSLDKSETSSIWAKTITHSPPPHEKAKKQEPPFLFLQQKAE